MSEFFCDSLPHMDTDESSCALNDQQLSADQLQSEEASVMEHDDEQAVPKLLSEIIKPPPTPPPEPETNAALLAANLSAAGLPNPMAFIEEIKSKNQQQSPPEPEGEESAPPAAPVPATQPEDATRSPPPPPPVVVDLKTKTSPVAAAPEQPPLPPHQPQQTKQAESLRIRTPLVAVAAAAAAAAAASGFPIEHRQHQQQQPSANGLSNGGEMAVLGEVTDQQSKGCAASDLESPTKSSRDSDSQDGSKSQPELFASERARGDFDNAMHWIHDLQRSSSPLRGRCSENASRLSLRIRRTLGTAVRRKKIQAGISRTRLIRRDSRLPELSST